MEERFLINTITDWSEPPRARHQVTSELSKKYKVVFVNANYVGLPRLKKKVERENLTILYPTFPVNFKIRYRIPIVNELYQRWLFKKLAKEYPGYQMINFDFSASLIHKYFDKVIYYCNDNFTRISKRINPYFIYKYHERCEEKVATKALFCIATSGILKEKLQAFNPKSFEIPLGGPDMKEFGIKVPLIKPSGGKIKLGLVGFIRDSNTSAEILNDLLNTGKFEISLIGPIDPVLLSKIEKKEDLKLLGILIEKALYQALNKVDIAIAPYHFNKLDFGTTPNKLLIYLALGKPAVVTHLKAINTHRY
ncbi:MAG TPA: hypothetical protein VHO90_11765, partial [Bacteroidales bacterium]|nr:hypothetical protein [Bacteroidales bacterium]